jgi:iron complex outermembrane receptor protein
MRALLLCGMSFVALGLGTGANAQEALSGASAAGTSDGIAEIIVTAQKRQQSAADVPLSINVASGDQLAERRVTDVSDLAKIAPGFTATTSSFGVPVFTLRGVGFYDTSVAAKPSVSVYVDEVPLPFSQITQGATLDLDRVEVLKGPQGTLFGQNSTGGAINYIAAKPKDHLEAGVSADYGRFGLFTADGYISGPLSDTVGARLAVKTMQGGAWQRSLTRPGDTLGDKDLTMGRLLLDFKPTDALKIEVNLNGYIDKSDELAAQYIALTPLNPYVGIPGLPGTAAAVPLDAAPRALGNARQADWTPNPRPHRDHRFWQASIRGDYDFSDAATLTSITAYSDYKHDQFIDPDGIAANDYFYHTTAGIKSFSQELRVSGKIDNLNYIVGGNYSKETTFQTDVNDFRDATSAFQFTDGFQLAGVAGFPPFYGFINRDNQTFTNKALFANVDYGLGDKVILHGGIRYTKSDIDFKGCTADNGTGSLALGYQTLLNSIRPGAGLPLITVTPGTCVTTSIATLAPVPYDQTGQKLSENNVSWRAGIDFKPTKDTLLYGSVSRGFKSGSFPLLGASDTSQFFPVTQESVTAYELGFKATVLDRAAQISGAVFYYDYRDKQLKGRLIATPNIFGPLERLFNVPKSSITGAEIQIDLRPTRGLRLSVGATYLDSKVKGSFNNIDSYGNARDFAGSPFPYTPKYQVVADSQYNFDLNAKLGAFLGGGLTYNSATIGALGPQTSYQYPALNALGGLSIKAYTLVGLRAGLETADHKYRASVYVDNLFNEYYWTNAARITDTTIRYAGKPRTFGVTLSARY